jgi:two-component system CheB/CheR fusion protein
MPYRTFDDRIDGLVITFINISDLKEVEIKLHQAEMFNRFILNSSSDIVIKLSADWKILEFNHEAEKFFGKKLKDVIDQSYIQLFIPEPLRHKTENKMDKLLRDTGDRKFKMEVIAAGTRISYVICSIYVLRNKLNKSEGIFLSLKK